jgi:hypothetical protein
MLDKITIVCFAASYGVALALEISRLFFRMPVRMVVILGFVAAGLLAHTIFLWNRAQPGIAAGVPLSSWYLWLLLASWILTFVYLSLASSKPDAAIGIFMLPVVLGLIAAATLVDDTTFPKTQAEGHWLAMHGMALLIGTVTTALGFIAGLMYLIQSYRLKHKLPPRPGFHLPSLEWLQAVNKQSLYLSSLLVAVGVFAGVVVNMLRQGVPWTDRVVLSSAGLLAWLFVATLFELAYKPAQQGRKVAYLTVMNFVFLAAVLTLVLFSGSAHAVGAKP